MKKKLLVILAALLIFGLTAGAYAIRLNHAAPLAKASCCGMADCCKDGHCAMGGSCCKDKQGQTASAESKDSCCGMADCCKDGHCSMGGDCCKGHDDCPMKNKEESETKVDMSHVIVVGGTDG